MRKFILLIIMLLLLVSGCNTAPTSPPEYLLQLNQRCTGFAVDNTHFMTAAHCVPTLYSAVTIYGQQLQTKLVYMDTTKDVAIIQTDLMLIDQFATFNEKPYIIGSYYGNCQLYNITTGRAITYIKGTQEFVSWPHGWVVMGYVARGLFNQFGQQNVFCPGDSGGFVVVNNQISGMGIAIPSNIFLRKGEFIYAVPSKILKQVWEDYRALTTGNR